jgi:hypothetical protein
MPQDAGQRHPPVGVRLSDQRNRDFKKLQAMKMAMKASKKISTAPAAGMTTGMCLTTFSTGSSDV